MRPTIRAAFRPRTDDMPRYIATVSTDRSPEEVFAYLSDLTTFAEWDPGVERVELVAGTAGGDDAVYDVTLDRGMTLRYEVTQFVPARVGDSRGEIRFARRHAHGRRTGD